MSDTNIMGFIPKGKYVFITYALILVSCVVGLLTTLLAIAGVFIPLGGLASIVGFAGLIMGLLGFFVFKKEFSALDQAHLAYISALFGIFFIIGFVIGIVLGAIGMALVFVVMSLLGLVQMVLYFTGFNSWKHGRVVTKDNVASEVQLALKRA